MFDEEAYTQAVNEAFIKMAATTNDKDFWEVMNNWPKKEDFTTKEDIDYTVECLTEVITKLRELSPVNDAKGW